MAAPLVNLPSNFYCLALQHTNLPVPNAATSLGRNRPGTGLAFPSWRSSLSRELGEKQFKFPLSFVAWPEFQVLPRERLTTQ